MKYSVETSLGGNHREDVVIRTESDELLKVHIALNVGIHFVDINDSFVKKSQQVYHVLVIQ